MFTGRLLRQHGDLTFDWCGQEEVCSCMCKVYGSIMHPSKVGV
jgi:hypothetical protein